LRKAALTKREKMAANAVDKSFVRSQEPFGFHFSGNRSFDGEGKIQEWRAKLFTLYPNLLANENKAGRYNKNENSNVKNMNMDIGGIRVFVRKRPMFTEKDQGVLSTETIKNYDTITTLDPFIFIHSEDERLGVKNGKLKSVPYRFHGTFHENTTNNEIYKTTCQPLIKNILDSNNFNVENTIICYGQTGGGKTFTQMAMYELGLLDIFKTKKEEQKLSISFFENCGDRVFDLLNDRNEMKIQEDSEGNVIINGVKWRSCKTIEDALKVVREGSQLRATHPTKNNPSSSRSHALCSFLLHGTNNKLTFVDLAGSERKKDVREHSQERLAEMQQINWSLGTLKQCVRDLIEKKSVNPKKHVNFRNSKLTLLLKKIFVVNEEGDKSNRKSNFSVFIGCVSPLHTDKSHTDATIKYMEELMSVDIYLQNRVATIEELIRHLQLFYLEFYPSKATRESVVSILNKFKGKEYNLYKGIKKKYRRAPKILLMSEGAIDRQKNNPLKWSIAKLKNWLKSLENGKYCEYVEKFNISGSALYSLSVHDVIDRCGGGSHCAAFNDAEHILFDDTKNSNIKEQYQQTFLAGHEDKINVETVDEKLKMDKHAEAAKEIFQLFRKVRNEFNK
jgi:hypothetical protein